MSRNWFDQQQAYLFTLILKHPEALVSAEKAQ
jgi:hypothetical protein